METRQDILNRELLLVNRSAGYFGSIVCTDQGLLIASAGDLGDLGHDETLAGFTSLFDDIVARAQRDLYFTGVDEITLLDAGRGRLVIRPINRFGESRMMLVVSMPADTSWRRNTTRLALRLARVLAPMFAPTPEGA